MMSSKRIQFHIDAATALPFHKNSSRPFVTVKIDNANETNEKEQLLRTSTARCDSEHDPSWQQNLTASTMSPTCQVTFEVLQRSPVWAPGKPNKLAVTDAYPLSTLLDMQGGNMFGTNIELPLHPTTSDGNGNTPSARLSVNIRELASRETANLAVRLSAERRKSQEASLSPVLRAPSPTHVSFATPATLEV
ncbi:C2 domain-containing protein [Mycena indigotica]|uniref:C2 domain-containing protein n=1 Tax=Mycena indigotica TaxID=2126181 RepID=A0A8H6TGS7_9AGAR|nr:C2 domain-containing protein [Mycena indigotica]KAF7315475.1 C2 domain-containing protein [Mycena indigotica]